MPRIAKGKPHSVDGIVLPIISHVSPEPPKAAYNPAAVIIVPETMKPIKVEYLLPFLIDKSFFSAFGGLFAQLNISAVTT